MTESPFPLADGGCKTVRQQVDARRHKASGPGLEVFMDQRVASKHRSECKTCGIPPH